MIRRRVAAYRLAVQAKVRAAMAQDHPPRLIGLSFALGLFVLTLPTLGAGLVLLAAVGYRFAWANRVAVCAAAVVLNPIVKAGVLAISFALGSVVVGPLPAATFDPTVVLTGGKALLVRLFVGNALLASGFALAGYVVAVYGARSVRRYRASPR